MAKIVLDPEAFKVLASDTRLALLKSLDARPKTVSELAREHELNKATVFEHLQHLVKGELVKKKDSEGRKWVYYALSWKGRSLLHPEQTTFMVLFSLAALGSVGAMFQLGNWLKWWALDAILGSDGGSNDGRSGDADQEEAGAPEGATQPADDSDAASDNTTSLESPAEAPGDGDGGAAAADSDPGGFLDFAGDLQFWIFLGLLLATAALVVSGLLVRRRGRQLGPRLELATLPEKTPAKLKAPGNLPPSDEDEPGQK